MLFYHKYKAGDTRKYEGLLISASAKELLENDPNTFASYCNGVGSRVGFWSRLIYHFIPDFIGLINITPSSDIHDVEYTVPVHFPNMRIAWTAFRAANMRFLDNLTLQIERGTRLSCIKDARYRIAGAYYKIVSSETGWIAFMDGRSVYNSTDFTDDDLSKYYKLMSEADTETK